MRILFFCLLWFLLAPISVCTAQSLGQKYFSEIHLAEKHRFKKEYELAVKHYKNAFAIKDGFLPNYRDAMLSAIKFNDTLLINNWMLKCVSKGFTDTQIYPMIARELGKDSPFILDPNIYEQTRKEYLSRIDEELNTTLIFLEGRDQAVRVLDDYGMEWRFATIMDSLNQDELKELVKNLSKWPPQSELGADGASALSTLVHHFDFDAIQYFMPYMLESIHAGESNLQSTIAYQLDRIAMDAGYEFYIDSTFQLENLGKSKPLLSINNRNIYYPCMAHISVSHSELKKNFWLPLYDKFIINGRTDASRKRLCLDSVKESRARFHWKTQLSKEAYRDLFK